MALMLRGPGWILLQSFKAKLWKDLVLLDWLEFDVTVQCIMSWLCLSIVETVLYINGVVGSGSLYTVPQAHTQRSWLHFLIFFQGSKFWVCHRNSPRTALQQREAAFERRQVGERDSCKHWGRLLVSLILPHVCTCHNFCFMYNIHTNDIIIIIIIIIVLQIRNLIPDGGCPVSMVYYYE